MTTSHRARPATRSNASVDADRLALRYIDIRAVSLQLAAPLGEADCQVQSMPDASPAKWHLAHITWFFETFVLERWEHAFKPFRAEFRVLFNSYYNGIGAQHPRPQRGLITRPTLAEVKDYRAAVDERMLALLRLPVDDEQAAKMAEVIELGLQHEQQHQELMLTDVLHLFSCNPHEPVYRPRWPLASVAPTVLEWAPFEGGLVEMGTSGSGFSFDNEGPRHPHWLRPYALASRLTTHGEWADFIADGGYREPRWWLAAGWEWVQTQHIEAPLYWVRNATSGWDSFTLHGRVAIDPHTPVTHISLFEADAYARWAAAQQGLQVRLPSEGEWEHAAAPLAASGIASGNFLESMALHPVPVARPQTSPMQLFGDVWEWTSSPYRPYPGFRAWEGAVAEYNAKFMVDQAVLRGGSCATPRSHIRATYRNFFPANARWQFNGLRLARDID